MADYTKYTPVLSKVKIGDQYYYLKDKEAREAIDSILADYLTAADKSELQAAIATNAGAIAIINGEATQDGSIKKALADAKAYTDAETTRATTEEARLEGLIAAMKTITYEIVSVLPTAGADYEFNTCKTVYMMLDPTATGQDVYDEFICVNKGTTASPSYAWEKIGSTRIDLSNYYTKEEIDDLLDDKQDKLPTDLSGFYKYDSKEDEVYIDTTEYQHKLTAGNYITINPTTNTIDAYGPDGASIELAEGSYRIKGINNATNNQVLAYDSTNLAVKWVDVSAVIPGAVVPVSDNQTINVTQDQTDPNKYIVSLMGKDSAATNSVIRKHVNGSTTTYTWDVIYSATEVDNLLAEKADVDDFVEQTVMNLSVGTEAIAKIDIYDETGAGSELKDFIRDESKDFKYSSDVTHYGYAWTRSSTTVYTKDTNSPVRNTKVYSKSGESLQESGYVTNVYDDVETLIVTSTVVKVLQEE